MENQTKQGLTPMQPENLSTTLKPSLGTEIVKQKDAQDLICQYLLGIWVNARIEIMQMSPTLVPTESKEEFGLIQRMIRQYGTITPAEFAECIRMAAMDKVKDLAAGQMRFPTLYFADFEEQIQRLTLRKMKDAESNQFALPQNVGGNHFQGDAPEVLSREWPKIVRNTNTMKQINPQMIDRFWLGGSQDQRDSARGLLRQMVKEMQEAGKWDQQQVNLEALAAFQREYTLTYPKWENLLGLPMTCPMSADEVAEIKQRTRWKIQQVTELGGTPPKLEDFPDPHDATFQAIFKAYWKFKGEK